MATEKRLIDAFAYCKELYMERDYPGRTQEFMDAIEVAIADLGDMPTVDAVEVVHGRWNKETDMDEDWGEMDYYKCSVCGKCQFGETNYCPNCGAKMDGE